MSMTVKITTASRMKTLPCSKAVLREKKPPYSVNDLEDEYTITIDTLEDLLDLLREVKDIIIYTNPQGDPEQICIYDDYVE